MSGIHGSIDGQAGGGIDLSLGGGARTLRGRATRALAAAAALVLLFAVPAEAQEHRVTGRVTTDGTGEPIAGIQVRVDGTSVMTLTDADGRYALTAPSSSGTLIFSGLGYAERELAFDDQAVVNAELEVTALLLDEIVTIGYGEKSRANLTESVGVVSASDIQKVTVASADQAIQGRVAGAQIVSQSGTPGSPVAIRIRGVGTIGNTQPLFVIDGIPVGRGETARTNPLAIINPADIESISVLKDASAASLYGVQAANGVVLITTRRGEIGKPMIRYDAYQGFQRMPRYYDVNGTDEWFAMYTEALDNYNNQMGYDTDHSEYRRLPPRIRQGSAEYDPSLLQRNTDWQRIPLNQNAPIVNHNLSVSGATDQTSYFVSAGYFAQEAIQQRWDIDRISFRANSDFQINDRIRFGETFMISNQRTERGHHQQGDGRVLHNSLKLPPIYLYRDPDCQPSCPGNRYGYAGNVGVLDGVQANQAAINHIQDIEERSTRILAGLHGEVTLLPGLRFRSQGNIDYQVSRQYQWTEGYSLNEVGLDRNTPVAEEGRNENYSVILTNTLNYNNRIGAHDIGVLAGLETQQYNWDGIYTRRTNFLSFDEAIRRITGGAGAIPHDAFAGDNAFLGYLGRLTYNYDNRYLLTASVRRDGASEFAPGHRWGTFPSVSAGWRLSQERFIDVPWITELKLRGSWGQLGNSSIEGGAYPHLLRVAPQSTYVLGGTRSPQDAFDVPIPLPRFPNPELTWEETTTTDLGFDVTLFDDRFDLSATYYNKKTGGFLLNVDLPPSSGFDRAPFNSGEVSNRGLELELGYRPPRLFGEFDLQISANLTTVRNRLLSLAEQIEEYAAPGDGGVQSFAQHYRTAPGYPVGYFYGFKTCGIYRTDAEAAAAPQDNTISHRPQAGDMCFVDVNGDGMIDDDDRTFIGSSIPSAFFGLNLSGTLRRFDVTAFFNGVLGVELYNLVRRDLEHLSGGSDNQLTTTRERWTPQNPNASLPRAVSGDPAGNNRFSDRWIDNGSYLRLRTLQLGYTLPRGFAGTTNTRVYLSAQNLLTITSYSGYDPEFTTTIDHWRSRNDLALFQGTDSGDMPQPRLFQIGVSTSF